MTAAAPSSAPAQTPAQATPAGSGGTAAPVTTAPSWRADLSPDLRDNPTIVGFGDDLKKALPSMAKEVVELKSMIGKKGIVQPTPNDPPEAWDKFYADLGRPESPDKYDLTGFQAPEGVPWDDSFIQAMLPKMHTRGASQSLVKGILEDYASIVKDQWSTLQSQLQENAKQAEIDLRKEWGAAYGAKMDYAVRALKGAAGEAFDEVANIQMADGTKFGNHPGVLRVMAALGEARKDHPLMGDKSTRLTPTPDEAAVELRKLEAKDSPYWNAEHPEHSQAVKRYAELMAAKNS